MKLTVNGEPKELPENATVSDLIQAMGFQGRAVAVEVNRELIPHRAHEQTALSAGDAVELVTLVGGD